MNFKSGTTPPEWTLLETLSYSNESTKTTGTLTPMNYYLIVSDVIAPTTGGIIELRINGDTGANYGERELKSTSVTNATGGTYITVNQDETNTPAIAEIFIKGKSPAVASGEIPFHVRSYGRHVADILIGGTWVAGNNVQIENFTILGSNTLTGTVKVYGKN